MITPLVMALSTLIPAQPTTETTARAAAAEVLEASLTEARRHEDDAKAAVVALVRGGREAGARLDGDIATQLAEMGRQARWMALSDEVRALRWLEDEMRLAIDDLVFEPIIESEMPEGFPAPTPVRDIELKRFPGYRMAYVETGKAGSQGAFWTLFSHIKKNDIAMTAPVEMTLEPEGERMRETSMAFLYRSPELGEPGMDGAAEVVDVPAGWAVSIGCRGSRSDAMLEAAIQRLESWIAARPKVEIAGPPRVMGYNSPMVPTARRYFEVQIPVRPLR